MAPKRGLALFGGNGDGLGAKAPLHCFDKKRCFGAKAALCGVLIKGDVWGPKWAIAVFCGNKMFWPQSGPLRCFGERRWAGLAWQCRQRPVNRQSSFHMCAQAMGRRRRREVAMGRRRAQTDGGMGAGKPMQVARCHWAGPRGTFNIGQRGVVKEGPQRGAHGKVWKRERGPRVGLWDDF